MCFRRYGFCTEDIIEIQRGIRQHYTKLVSSLDGGAAEKAQLGLGHSYSRAHVKFNVNREDNMIIQAICILDQVFIILSYITRLIKI